MVDYMQKLQTMLSAPPEVAMRAPRAASPVLSSLGIIENILRSRYEGAAGAIDVEDCWLGVQVMNRSIPVHLWTYDGRMHLSCNYNEAFYEREFVERLVEEWKAVLVDGLLG